MRTTLTDVLAAWQRDTLGRLRVAVPAVVTAYDPAPLCRVNVNLVLQGRDAVGTPQVPPPLYSVPVLWPRGGGFTLQWDLAAGDEVMLLVADRALDRYLTQGGVVDLESDRAHELGDAMCIPGLSTAAHPRPASTGLVLGREDGTAVLRISPVGASIELEGPEIRLGVGATVDNHVAIAELVHSYLAALFASGVPVAMDGGAALQTAWQLYLATNPPSAFAATKAIAEGP